MLTKTEQYEQGIESFNNFHELLSNSLHSVMPDVKLGQNCGYGWRGYQIKEYESLFPQRYYFEIYLDNPCVLKFSESYIESPYHYKYPFSYPFDLSRTNFFDEDLSFQKTLLMEFISLMEKVAYEWQNSELRKLCIPIPEQNLKITKPNERKHNWKYEKIYSYVEAINQQNDLLDDIRKIASNTLGKQCLSLNRQKTNSRSWWARVNTIKGYDFVWRIYYDKPLKISFEKKTGESIIDPFDLEECKYFDLILGDQKSKLEKFVKNCLDIAQQY
jgi:hypothetical protein